MKITVLGLGYIGLPTAAMFAQAGHTVQGFDINESIRSELADRAASSKEPELYTLVEEALASGKFDIVDRVSAADAYIICVPTPTIDDKPDLRSVENAAARIAEVAEPGAMVVLESTVPPGSTERILRAAFLAAGKNSNAFTIAHAPERVLPGAIVHELRHNPRVIGTRVPQDAKAVKDLYASICGGEISMTDCLTAELTKIVENTYRDVNLAFANELSVLAEELGVDVWETIALANQHPRVNILRPGPGVGGHCIPVDPQFLSNANPFVTELIQTARRVNARMPHRIARRIMQVVPGASYFRKVALLGAAYKADVDDARESPTAQLDYLLRERGFTTSIFDPHVSVFSRPLCATLEDALRGADAVVLMTDHTEFKALDPARVGPLMRRRILIDTRNIFCVEAWQHQGFDVFVLGGRTQGNPSLRASVA